MISLHLRGWQEKQRSHSEGEGECNEWAENLDVNLSRKEGPSGHSEQLGGKGRRKVEFGKGENREQCG